MSEKKKKSKKKEKKVKRIGSRAEVFHGNAHQTSGGLTRDKLSKNKEGRIISIKASQSAIKCYRSKDKNGKLGGFVQKDKEYLATIGKKKKSPYAKRRASKSTYE
tara:strand:- start:638 stop:952 length:315 start_codon:yes stop_codon:yes gene_type:complete